MYVLPCMACNFTLNIKMCIQHKLLLKSLVRYSHKLVTDIENTKTATDVVKYLDSFPEYSNLKEKIPANLLKKYRTPENMYIINKKTAEDIARTVKSHILPENPVVEVNPGFGLLSEELLKNIKNNIYMYETNNFFSPYVKELQDQWPDRVIYRNADFFGLWKLAFKDKADNGNRIKDLLRNLSTDDDNRIVKIIGSMPTLNYIKHLMHNIIFHYSQNQLGRPDLFITMPGHHYKFLTDNQIELRKYKSIPALFQLLFDFKVLATVPKVHFLPWTHPPVIKKTTMIDEHNMYLVNITQKEKLPCPPEYLPLLWYFFRPQMFSVKTKIIPKLEQWIPGCGVWLITGQDPPDSNKKIAPGKDDAELPHMTIFTEFGDLTLKQKITVFKKFVSWPEFEQCPFKVTMESNLPKFVINLDNDKDNIGTHIDDVEHSDTEVEN